MPPHHGWGGPLLITIFPTAWGLYIPLGRYPMSVVSVVFSVQGFFRNRKYKGDKKERVEYSTISNLKDKAKGLEQLSRKQREGIVLPISRDQRLDQDGQTAYDSR